MQVLLQIIFIVVVKLCENLRIEDNFNNTFQKYAVPASRSRSTGTQRKCNEKDYSQSYPYKEK